MPPKGFESEQRRKGSTNTSKNLKLKRGVSEEDANRIAAATTNKTKKERGETKS